ncbi:flippase [Cupriavidus sp. 30B13]|uniref:flippase n=1 Tax=Cupriavidus sp. 30B13 TaxID=3384241 RepID=UPI003B8F4331
MSSVRAYARSGIWVFIEKAIRLFSSLAVGIVLARYLGPADFGDLSYAQSVIGLLAIFITLGLEAVVVRRLVQRIDSPELVLGSAALSSLAAATVSVMLVLVFALLFVKNAQQAQYICILSISIPLQVVGTVSYAFQADSKMGPVMRAQIIQVVVSLVVKLMLALLNAPPVFFVWSVVADAVVLAGLLYVVGTTGGTPIFQWRFSGATAMSMLKESWPLIFAGIGFSLCLRISQVTLNHYWGSTVVGEFSVAARIFESTCYLAIAVTRVVGAPIFDARLAGNVVYTRRLQAVYDLTSMGGILLGIGVSIFGAGLVHLLFGGGYLNAGKVFELLMWATLPIALLQIHTIGLVAEARSRETMWRVAALVLFSIMLNLALVPSYGAVGAAWAMLLSQSITSVLFLSIRSGGIPHFSMVMKSLVLPLSVARIARSLNTMRKAI